MRKRRRKKKEKEEEEKRRLRHLKTKQDPAASTLGIPRDDVIWGNEICPAESKKKKKKK